MRAVETVVLCEGYHDRAFWRGLLLTFGCNDPGDLGDGTRKPVPDPAGRNVPSGQFVFRGPGDVFVRLVPAHTESSIWPTATGIIADRLLRTSLLVACFDADTEAGVAGSIRAAPPRLRELLNRHDARVEVLMWRCDDPPDRIGVPNQQSLERLACAALADVYPGRAQAVQQWLADQRVAGKPAHKAHAWSYMAGWNADDGCQFFYERLWQCEPVRAALERRLHAIAAWPILESLVTGADP